MPEEFREKIAKSQILTRLIGHVEGKVEMTPSQVTAGLGLLKKCLPDMTYNEHVGKDGGEIPLSLRVLFDKEP